MRLHSLDEIMERLAHLDESVGELPQFILGRNGLWTIAQIAFIQKIARANHLFNIDGKAVRHQEYDARYEQEHHKRQAAENAEEAVRLSTNFARRNFTDNDPAASVELHRHEHCRHVLAVRVLIVNNRHIVLIENALKACNERRRIRLVGAVLAKIQLADLRLIRRIHDDDTGLVYDHHVFRTMDKESLEVVVKIRKPNRSCHHARHRAVIKHGNRDDDNHLPCDARDNGFGDHRRFCLHRSFEIVADITVKIVIVNIKAHPVETDIGHIREYLRMRFNGTERRKACLAIAAQNRRIPRQILQMRLVAFKHTPCIQPRLFSNAYPYRLGIRVEHIACRLVTDAKEHEEADEYDRKNKR